MSALRTVLLALLLSACATAEQDWVTYETVLKAQAKLRTDRDPPDVRYSNTDLAQNFHRVAFGVDPEFETAERRRERLSGQSRLRRWQGRVTFRTIGLLRPEDGAVLDALLERIRAATALEIRPVAPDDATPADLLILFLDAEGRRRFSESFARDSGGGDIAATLDALYNDDSLVCSGRFYQVPAGRPEEGVIKGGLIFIRAELPRDLRLSCIEEEVAQVFGLARDDPAVRPSIFNENQEFARLTAHDEYLLRILYDPRLRPGMTAAEARPVVRRIVADLRPEARGG